MNISFIGLGKLGLPLACCLAESGNKIYALDKNDYFIDCLNQGKTPFYETGLEELFNSNKENFLAFDKKYDEAIKNSQAAVILVNTQMGDDGYSSRFVESALTEIAENIRNKEDYFTIILSSTVLPKSIKNELIPLVERVSNKKFEIDFGFSYVPDFVKLGNVVHDFKNPEFFLIGANNERDYELTKKIFQIHQSSPKTFKLTLEETEIAKVSLNAYIVEKISFANFLGCLCENIDNVDVHNITKVIGIDKRISPHFFSSGAPYGGTCFPRDTAAFISFARSNGFEAKNIIFAEEVNDLTQKRIFDQAVRYNKIGIIGMSFKPQSPVVVASPSCKLLSDLVMNNKEIHCFDFLEETFSNIKEEKYIKCNSIEECVEHCDVLVLMHYDKRFKDINFKGKKVIDVWGIV